jgi:hypothetical protein
MFNALIPVLGAGLVIVGTLLFWAAIQRLFAATARAVFRNNETGEVVTREEVKQVRQQDLPADVLTKLEKGETLQYEMSVGSMKVQEKSEPTYRLVVRRSE